MAAVLTTIFLASCGGGDSGDDAGPSMRMIGIVSGSQMGIYYPTAILFQNIFNDEIPDLRVNVETSGGSVANAKLVGRGEADMALMQNDIAFYAERGEQMFDEKIENLRAVTSLYSEVVHILALKDSGIESVADLRGRKVSIGAPGSGTEYNARQILEAYGISLEDLGLVERLMNTEAGEKLKDGHIEAAFLTYGLGAPVIEETAVTIGIVLLPIGEEQRQKLLDRYPYYTADEIPAGTYEGVADAVPTVAVMAWLVASADLDEELVYQMTASLLNNLDRLHSESAPARLKAMSLEHALDGLSIQLHPGSRRFYSEKGLNP